MVSFFRITFLSQGGNSLEVTLIRALDKENVYPFFCFHKGSGTSLGKDWKYWMYRPIAKKPPQQHQRVKSMTEFHPVTLSNLNQRLKRKKWYLLSVFHSKSVRHSTLNLWYLPMPTSHLPLYQPDWLNFRPRRKFRPTDLSPYHCLVYPRLSRNDCFRLIDGFLGRGLWAFQFDSCNLKHFVLIRFHEFFKCNVGLAFNHSGLSDTFYVSFHNCDAVFMQVWEFG